jgi:hypothetical protein
MPVRGTGRAAQVLPRAVFGLAALICVACYRPNIKDGGFLCNVDAGPSNECPSGFTCDRSFSPPQCWQGPHDAGPGDRGPDTAEAGRDAEVDADGGPPCFDARPSCDPSDAGACDPFCQVGCGCREKCEVSDVDGGASYSCAAVPTGAGGLLDSCDTQRDNCGPGLVCLDDNCGGRCYAYCRTDDDCGGSAVSACARTGPGGLMVCDVPNVDSCNPVAGSSANCPKNNQGCYISYSRPTHTLCDCPGGIRLGYPCTGSRSCLFGALCVDATGSGTPTCQRVCRLANSAQDCQAPQTCQIYVGNSASNPPNPTFGFCL